jgi:hypothetical protein
MSFRTKFSIDVQLRHVPEGVVRYLRHSLYMDGLDCGYRDGPPCPNLGLFGHALLEDRYGDHVLSWGQREYRRLYPLSDGSLRLEMQDGELKNGTRVIEKLVDFLLPWCVPQQLPFIEAEDDDHWQYRFFTDGRAEIRRPRVYDLGYRSFLGRDEPTEEKWEPTERTWVSAHD